MKIKILRSLLAKYQIEIRDFHGKVLGINLEDEIVDQLIEEDLDTLNSYFKK